MSEEVEPSVLLEGGFPSGMEVHKFPADGTIHPLLAGEVSFSYLLVLVNRLVVVVEDCQLSLAWWGWDAKVATVVRWWVPVERQHPVELVSR